MPNSWARVCSSTVLVAGAGETIVRVRGQDEFDDRLPDLNQFSVVGDNAHVLGDGGAAGSEHLVAALHPHDTDPARRPRGEVGVVAERGYLDVGFPWPPRGQWLPRRPEPLFR